MCPTNLPSSFYQDFLIHEEAKDCFFIWINAAPRKCAFIKIICLSLYLSFPNPCHNITWDRAWTRGRFSPSPERGYEITKEQVCKNQTNFTFYWQLFCTHDNARTESILTQSWFLKATGLFHTGDSLSKFKAKLFLMDSKQNITLGNSPQFQLLSPLLARNTTSLL